MKGRKPKPVQRAIAEGDTRQRGVHKIDAKIAALPKAQRGLPDPQSHLQSLAREKWYILKRDLELKQMDYSCDAVMLEGGCINYARAIEADEELKDGCTMKEPLWAAPTGAIVGYRLKNNPAVARSSTCWRNVRSFCSELGLSLVSPQRLATQAGDTTGSDEWMDLLLGCRPKRDDEPVSDD